MIDYSKFAAVWFCLLSQSCIGCFIKVVLACMWTIGRV